MERIFGFLAGVAAMIIISCGGGDSFTGAAATALPQALASCQMAFVENWEPRTAETGVFGVVGNYPLVATPDKSDPQQSWAYNAITGRWGTLAGMDGGSSSLPDVTGTGPNQSWAVHDGRLWAHAGAFALITNMAFDRTKRLALETDMEITKGGDGAFMGVTLITGEGDYRELSIRRVGTTDYLKRNTPLEETVLGTMVGTHAVFRIEYDPVEGFRYFVNGQKLGQEALAHMRADFATDPQVGLYFTGESGIVEGSVGPIKVWVGCP
jgi:hypothetical protein